jgi:hypothetical protein
VLGAQFISEYAENGAGTEADEMGFILEKGKKCKE